MDPNRFEVRPGALDEGERVIRGLHEITGDSPRGFDVQLLRLLELGRQRFDLEVGVLASVRGASWQVVKAVAPDDILLDDGDTLDLGDTFCALTLEAGSSLGLEHVARADAASHPAHERLGFEAYLGAPVLVGGETFGTLSFASRSPHSRRFRDVDVDALQLMSVWVGGELHRQRTEQALRAATERMEHLTRIDPLTQLFNRRGLEEKLVRLSRRCSYASEPLSALVIELDDLESVNEMYGHEAGDDVLCTTADTIVRTLRPTDLLGRVRGAGFVALLPATTEPDARTVADRLCSAVAKQTVARLAGNPSPPVSVGVALLDLSTHTIAALLERAAGALQESRRERAASDA